MLNKKVPENRTLYADVGAFFVHKKYPQIGGKTPLPLQKYPQGYNELTLYGFYV